jgi:hypothetical protein
VAVFAVGRAHHVGVGLHAPRHQVFIQHAHRVHAALHHRVEEAEAGVVAHLLDGGGLLHVDGHVVHHVGVRGVLQARHLQMQDLRLDGVDNLLLRLARFLQGGHLVEDALMQRGLLLLNHLPGGHRVEGVIHLPFRGALPVENTQNATAAAATTTITIRVHVLFISHPYP